MFVIEKQLKIRAKSVVFEIPTHSLAFGLDGLETFWSRTFTFSQKAWIAF